METISPEERLLTAMAQFSLQINNLQTFYGTTTDVLERGKDLVTEKFIKSSKEEMLKPEIQELFGAERCNAVMQHEGLINYFVKSFANRSVRLSKQMVGTSTLVFAHTILDELLTECCHIAFEAAPSDWHSLVDDRKIEVRALRTTDIEAIIHQKALELVREKTGQSMVKRFTFLNQICVPKLNGEKPTTSLVDLKRLEDFDQLRHQIIHGKPFAKKVEEVEEQVLFVALVGMAVFGLVGKAYKLFEKGDFSKEALQSKWLSEIRDDLPEVEELFSAVEQITKSLKQKSEQLLAVTAQVKL